MTVDLFPAWVPTEALLVGLAVTLAHILLFNRSREVVSTEADEPILVGIGATIIVAAWGVGPTVPILEIASFPLVGVAFVLWGYVARYTEVFEEAAEEVA